MVLPEGRYKIDLQVLGYKTKTIEFELGDNKSNYPVVELDPLPFDLKIYLAYLKESQLDWINLLSEFTENFRYSFRYFDLFAFITLIFLSFLTLISISQRMAVPIFHLPHFVVYHLTALIRKKKGEFIVHGKILGKNTGEIVPSALIYFANSKGKVLSHTRTNSSGEFLTMIHEATDLRISIIKKGFKNSSTQIMMKNINDLLTIEIVENNKPKDMSFQTIYWYAGFICGALFEAFLISTLLTELLFIMEFGILRILPFIIFSLLNIFLWAFHSRHSRAIGK